MITGQTYKIPIQTYPIVFVVSFNTRLKDFKNDVKIALELKNTRDLKIFNDHFALGGTSTGRTVRLSNGHVVISFFSINHGIIAHEIFHAVTLFLDALGVKFSMDSNEAYAYTIGYLTDVIYQILEENERVFSREYQHKDAGTNPVEDQIGTAGDQA